MTIDEILLSYRGRCSFLMYIPSKAAKFGLKIYLLVDRDSLYLVNGFVYLGKSSGESEKNMGEKVPIILTFYLS